MQSINFSNYIDLLQAISKAEIRYLVAGGVAMNFHGYARSTFDLDMILFLEKENILRFLEVVKRFGYVPRVPVRPEDFADENIRKQWIEEKNMVVFSFFKMDNPMDVVDVFVEHPRPFFEMYEARQCVALGQNSIDVVGLDDMLYLKKQAMRPKDLMDLRFLENIVKRKQGD